MEFLQKNARAIIIALLAIGVVVAISAASNSDNGSPASENESTVGVVDENGNVSGEDATIDNDDEQTQAGEDEATTNDSEGSDTQTGSTREVQIADESYTVSAAAGDNQTVLVREVINRYLSDKEFELSAPQMLYAETNLVNELPRDDVIFVGDTVRLSTMTVESTVNAARELSQARLDAWAAYL